MSAGAESRNRAPERDRARRAALRRQQQIRRRRVFAAAGAVGALLLVLLVASAFGGGSSDEKDKAASQIKPLSAAPDTASATHGRGIRAIDNVLGYTPFIAQGSPEQKSVALTFDDGPGPMTPQFVAALKKEHAPATFFVVSSQLADYKQNMQLALREGFEVGDHTETHPDLRSMDAASQKQEIDGAAQAIQKAGAPYPRLFRPPGGSFNDATLSILKKQRMLMVVWDVDTEDYTQPGTDAIVNTAVSGAKPGSIILMHDAGGPRDQTLAAVPQIIRGLRKRGFKLVTVPELISEDPPPHGQKLPPGGQA